MPSNFCSILLSSMILAMPLSLSASTATKSAAKPTSQKTHFAASPALLAPTDPSDAPVPQVITSGSATTPLPPMIVVSSSSFDPLTVLLKPTIKFSPLPSWALTAPKIDPSSSSIEAKLPPLSEQSEIENYTVTVTFQDTGDGGPFVEWVKENGERIMLFSGLGVNGTALGLNSETRSIPDNLAFDGGTIVVTHAGRFEKITSFVIRPGRTATVSALGGKNNPAIVDESGNVIQKNLASGEAPTINKGDSSHGNIISAELSGPVEHLDNEIEFIVPLHGLPEATTLSTDFIGLDIESHIDVQINGTSIGTLNVQSFQLDAPEFISSTDTDSPPFQIAGWRKGWLYIPSYLWKEGANNLLFIVKPGTHSKTSSSLFLRNTSLDLRYPATPTVTTPSTIT